MSKSKLIPAVWQMPDYFHGRLGDRVGRQRAMLHEGHLLLVLHLPAERSSRTREPVLFYRQPDGNWLSTAEGNGQVAMTRYLQRFDQLIDELDLREDKARTADEYFELIEDALPLKRLLANLHATLDDARKQFPQARELINFRDHAYDLTRSVDLLFETIDAASQLAHTRQLEAQARISHNMAESAHRLNLLVAFFFPLATLAAIFGMNLSSGLGHLNSPIPFLAVCSIGLVFGVFLLARVFRRTRRGPLS